MPTQRWVAVPGLGKNVAQETIDAPLGAHYVPSTLLVCECRSKPLS